MENSAEVGVLSTGEVCGFFGGINRSTLKRWVDDGKIVPLRKLPGETGGYLFELTEVKRFAAERAKEAASA